MERQAINLTDKLSRFSDHWSPKIIAQLNDYHFKLVKFQGEFVWHTHMDTDEAFLVLEGAMTIHFRDGDVIVSAGEMFVVPRGVEHKPVSRGRAHVLLFEPATTRNTGNVDHALTIEATDLEKI